MTDALKMVKLDTLTMKSQYTMFIPIVGIIMMFSFMETSFTVVSISGAWCVALMSSTVFAVQEKNSLDKFYGSVSVRLSSVVSGRYLFMIMTFLLTFVLVLIVYAILSLVFDFQLTILDIAFGLSMSFLVYGTITAVQIPMFYKLGYTKARIWSLFPLAIVMGLVVLPTYVPALMNFLEPLLSNEVFVVSMGIVLGAVVQVFSCRISSAIFSKKA